MVLWCGGLQTLSSQYAWSQLGLVKIVVTWGTWVTIPGGHCFYLNISVPMLQMGLFETHHLLSYLGLVLRIQRAWRSL